MLLTEKPLTGSISLIAHGAELKNAAVTTGQITGAFGYMGYGEVRTIQGDVLVLTNQRLLELALKGLETERRRIDEEIAEFRKQFHGRTSTNVSPARQPKSAAAVQRNSPLQGGPMSAAQKKAISETMRQRWAKRKSNQKLNRAVEGGQRQQVLLAAVRRLRAASIEDVARATGLDQRGIAGSFYYLVKNGQLKRPRNGKYALGSAQPPSGRSPQRR